MKPVILQITLILVTLLPIDICHGQTNFSLAGNAGSTFENPLMEDSVLLPQIFIKDRSLVVIIDSISRIQWEKTGKEPQNYVLQLFMVNNALVIYSGWIRLDWLIDAIHSRDDTILTVYFTGKKGKVIGFVGYNNSNFFIVDTGIPTELRDSIFEIIETSNMSIRPFKPLEEWNGEKVYDVIVCRGTDTYTLYEGKFVRCKIGKKQ